MSNFKPTFLYIKQHQITGMLYFGKTVQNNPVKYKGSGKYWKQHIRKYGENEVDTVWYCLYYDRDEINNFALQFSKEHNIVKSQLWANRTEETGIDDRTGTTHSDESKKLMSEKRKAFIATHDNPMIGRVCEEQSFETRNKRSKSLKQFHADNPEVMIAQSQRLKKKYEENPELRKLHSQPGEKNGMFGRERTDEWRKNHSKAMSGSNNHMYGKRGELSPNFGKETSRRGKTLAEICGEEAAQQIKEQMSQKATNRKKIICPHCGLEGHPSNMYRWHFTNCKKEK